MADTTNSGWRAIIGSSSVMSLALLGDALLYAVLPAYAADFGLTLPWVGVMLSANRFVRVFAYGAAGSIDPARWRAPDVHGSGGDGDRFDGALRFWPGASCDFGCQNSVGADLWRLGAGHAVLCCGIPGAGWDAGWHWSGDPAHWACVGAVRRCLAGWYCRPEPGICAPRHSDGAFLVDCLYLAKNGRRGSET